MKVWSRIILTAFVFVGSAALFGYWSISKFESAFEAMDSSFVANVYSAPSAFKVNEETEILDDALPNLNLSLVLPWEDEVYYPISWQSSTKVTSLEAALVDAENIESIIPIPSKVTDTSLESKESLENIKWKVEKVTPGKYYIEISKVNEQEITQSSDVFMVKNIPNGKKQATFCPKEGGE
jgi:hypothetical protein